MDSYLANIEDAAANLLSSLNQSEFDRAVIEKKVRAIAGIQGEVSESDIKAIVKKLETRFSISMDVGTLFSGQDYRPWLDDARGGIDWYYWDRYRRYLLGDRHYSPQVVRRLDSITDRILDHLQNPWATGKWSRRGMVVGHVQSGKTSNFVGLINKAADSGYRVIIVLGGMLNLLRNQTQERMDSGFLGWDTKEKSFVGVARYARTRRPAHFTTQEHDFRKSVANSVGVTVSDLKEPVLFVIKKNKITLDNLIDWLKNNSPQSLKDQPLLLIDDEADLASINTSKEGDLAPAINSRIRQLLGLFDRASYVGYTATPFANVFIDPDSTDEMLGDDLFPRDFITSLDAPSNYVGPDRVFSSNADLDWVRSLNDYEAYFPAKHTIGFRPQSLPPSLKEAMQVFILARAIRLLRQEVDADNSMLVNVTTFTAVQSQARLLIEDYLLEVRQAIVSYYKVTGAESLRVPQLAALKATFEREFRNCGFAWEQVRSVLKDSVSPIAVVEVNSSPSAKPLDYSRKNYPNGRNVIAVGGMNLSRGLTLEGLTVSYFLRNSIMYDTLMQMGRWFGYRDGYTDLCRIYMTPEAASWYAHISDASDELRDEFRRMEAAGMTPIDFGLCIRRHPESLIVTARNKMRKSFDIVRQVSLEGTLVETSVLVDNPDTVRKNREALDAVVIDANRSARSVRSDLGFLWKEVASSYVKQFVRSFVNHPASQFTETSPLIEQIEWLDSTGRALWDVILISPSTAREDRIKASVGDLPEVYAARRKVMKYRNTGPGIELNQRRVGSRGDEKAGMSAEEIKLAEDTYRQDPNSKKGSSVPDYAYRRFRTIPLLILHLLDCRLGADAPALFDRGIAAYGLSFPAKDASRKPKKLVEYKVNMVWWRTEYSEMLVEEELEEE